MSKWASLASVMVVLLTTHGLDRIWGFIRQDNARTFEVGPSLWFSGVLHLTFAALVLALGWLLLFKSEKSAIFSTVFLVMGLLLLFSMPLRALFPNLTVESFVRPFDRFVLVPPATFEFHAAAFIAVMGAANLLKSTTGLWRGPHSKAVASNL